MDAFFQPGDLVLGKYRVERVLGRGGMGIVLAARHIELGELFAIKLLLPNTLGQPGAVERFVREARATVRLKSEHVARVVDVGRLEMGVPYMVMEHLDGLDLAAVLRSRSPLPLEEAAVYVLQACEAISEAHAAGIVHRDIKPANLFLTRRANGDPCIKVLDFGISKCQDGGELDLTQEGHLLGSPQYISPERMSRGASADGRCDVWSMGVVLYRLVTGNLPFRGQTVYEIISSVQRDDPPPPSVVIPGLPPELDAVLGRALQKAPALRFQSIEELTEALRGAVWRPAPAPRLPLPSLASSSLLVPGVVTLPEATLTDATRRIQRRRRGHLLAGAWVVLAAAGILAMLTPILRHVDASAPISAPTPAPGAPETLAPAVMRSTLSVIPDRASSRPEAPPEAPPQATQAPADEPRATTIDRGPWSAPRATAAVTSAPPGTTSAIVTPYDTIPGENGENATAPTVQVASSATASDPTTPATPAATEVPAEPPSSAPIASPSSAPIAAPSSAPIAAPSSAPIAAPTAAPTAAPGPPASGTSSPAAPPRKKRTVL